MGRVRPLLGAGRHIQQAHAPPTKVQTLHRAVDWQPSPFPSPRLSDHVLHLQAPPPCLPHLSDHVLHRGERVLDDQPLDL